LLDFIYSCYRWCTEPWTWNSLYNNSTKKIYSTIHYSITYSERVFVALSIQHAKHMHSTITSSVACAGFIYFPHYYINGKNFGKVISHKMCEFWLSLQYLCRAFLFLRRIQWVIIINFYTALWKWSVIVVRFYWNLIFSTDFKKINKNALM
jgi:hypothetical protein